MRFYRCLLFCLPVSLLLWAGIILLIVSLSGCMMAPKKPQHFAFIGAGVADTVTTRQAIDRGAVEVNPVLGPDPSVGKLLAFKGGIFLGLMGLEKSGIIPSGVMRWLWWGGAGTQGVAAVHNAGEGSGKGK